MIYLDNNSTTRPSKRVLNAMAHAPWGNANSLHALGLEAKRAVNAAEASIRKAIGADDGYIMWTSGGAEANHVALDRENYYPGTRFICPATEHKSVIENKSNRGIIPTDKFGYIDPKFLLNQCYIKYSNTIALMMVNNETGLYHDLSNLTKLTSTSHLKIHTDAVQALGKVDIDVKKLGVDTLSISAHKIGGPKGVGALWSKNKLPGYKAPNTLNVPAIVGFGVAAEEIAPEDFKEHSSELLVRMLEYFWDHAIINNPLDLSINSTLNIRFPGVDGFELTQMLSEQGIYVSMGSACNASEMKPSHVLLAMGMEEKQALESIRISFSKENTINEVEEAARKILSCVRELRK